MTFILVREKSPGPEHLVQHPVVVVGRVHVVGSLPELVGHVQNPAMLGVAEKQLGYCTNCIQYASCFSPKEALQFHNDMQRTSHSLDGKNSRSTDTGLSFPNFLNISSNCSVILKDKFF